MTFDELWRLDLARQRAATSSASKGGADESDKLAFAGASADEPDEVEIERYLRWLEKVLRQDGPDHLR
jgi:hypothetical protein